MCGPQRVAAGGTQAVRGAVVTARSDSAGSKPAVRFLCPRAPDLVSPSQQATRISNGSCPAGEGSRFVSEPGLLGGKMVKADKPNGEIAISAVHTGSCCGKSVFFIVCITFTSAVK